jgi:hypothetical protein
MNGGANMEHERERNIENYLRHHLVELGIKCIKFIPDHANGMPDRLILLPKGRVIWVELKTDNGRLSEIQKYQHEILRGQGQEVVVVWNKEQAGELLDRIEAEYL